VGAERDDEPGLLRGIDELPGRDEPAGRVVPAHESLHADSAVVHEPEHRLVVDDELALAQGTGELRDEGRPVCDGRAHLELEQRAPAAAGPLRGVHRQVGVVQEREGGAPWSGQGDAGAGGGADAKVADGERLVECGEQPVRDALRAGRARPGQDDRELVTA